jgi:hypothetical protein
MEKVNIDGLSLHAAVGSLGVIEAQQRMPVSAMAIDPLIPNKRQIQIIWPMCLTETSEYAILIAWSLRDYYTSLELPISAADLVAGMISYLNCLLPPTLVEGGGVLTNALSYAGLSPAWRVANKGNLRTFQTPESLNILKLFSPGARQLFIHDRRQQLGLLGLILLLIGKTVTTAGYQGWVNNRLRTFRGVLGIIEGTFIWTDGTSPAQAVLATLSTFMSANQPLRIQLFDVCLRASLSQKSITTQILGTVVHLLRGVEMNHILLIDCYLFTKCPEILRIRSVRDNMVKYNQALSYLSSIPEDERLYVKIMKPRADTAVLNRNNFIMLSAAAYSAAKYEIPSMKNYQGGQDTAAGGHIDKIVTSYLTYRCNTAMVSMGRSPFAYMSVHERQLLEAESSRIARGLSTSTGITAGQEDSEEIPPLGVRARRETPSSTEQSTPRA